MSVSTQPKNFAGGVLRLSDATGTPVTLTALMMQGDYSLGPLGQDLNEDVVMSSRTRFIGLGVGAPRYPELSVSCYVGNLVGSATSGTGTMLEFVTGKGAYSANVSTLGANRRMTCDVRLTIEGTNWGDSADETIDAEDCRFQANFTEAGDGNKLEFTAQVLGAVVITNDANTVTYQQL